MWLKWESGPWGFYEFDQIALWVRHEDARLVVRCSDLNLLHDASADSNSVATDFCNFVDVKGEMREAATVHLARHHIAGWSGFGEVKDFDPRDVSLEIDHVEFGVFYLDGCRISFAVQIKMMMPREAKHIPIECSRAFEV